MHIGSAVRFYSLVFYVFRRLLFRDAALPAKHLRIRKVLRELFLRSLNDLHYATRVQTIVAVFLSIHNGPFSLVKMH